MLLIFRCFKYFFVDFKKIFWEVLISFEYYFGYSFFFYINNKFKKELVKRF